jgi:alpha(1,3/1,4) fucosyltransferase
MLVGNILGWDSGQDDLFNPFSTRNRDDCMEPFRILREVALQHDIELHTPDVNKLHKKTPHFNLYFESVPVDRKLPGLNFLIRFETELIVPINANKSYLDQFDLIFTWDRFFLESAREQGSSTPMSSPHLIEIRTPNPIPISLSEKTPSFHERSVFCCLIASNRHANADDPRELYSERVRAIRWFEKKAPNDFVLYGKGWNVPMKRFGRRGKAIYRLEKIGNFLFQRQAFPSYRGPIKEKQDALKNAKFCICYENARDIPGYLTEKIFDCFISGCVPIYWGAPDVTVDIPESCFIDFRKFASYYDLYCYLKKMPEKEFSAFQDTAQDFLRSSQFKPHGSHAFANTITKGIMNEFS